MLDSTDETASRNSGSARLPPSACGERSAGASHSQIRANDSNSNLHLAQLFSRNLILNGRQIILDRIADVRECFFLRVTLRPATGQPRDGHAEPFLRTVQDNAILHVMISSPTLRMPGI